jgi:hypothetical protein
VKPKEALTLSAYTSPLSFYMKLETLIPRRLVIVAVQSVLSPLRLFLPRHRLYITLIPFLPRVLPMSDSTYPTCQPTSAYDITCDPIHLYTEPGAPSVIDPESTHEYQLAVEAPPHLWPHNAEKLGFTRHFLAPETKVSASRGSLAYTVDGTYRFVHPAFLYV